MFVAMDFQGNRLYANAGERYTECRCPECNELVQHKIGKVRRPYFAHCPNSDCTFGNDKDNKSEWHIRMQEYFPQESREVRFVDEQTGEVHIADVYLQDSNTVLEFQHSQIKEEEFISRTVFHLNHGRRLVWMFDESTSSEDDQKYGRFSEDDCKWEQWPYFDRSFRWRRNPRRFLSQGPNLSQFNSVYSVCVYTGSEGDVFHRIVGEHAGFQYATFSLHSIEMSDSVDIEVFFRPEVFWQSQDPWKTEIERRVAAQKNAQRFYQSQFVYRYVPKKAYRRGRRL